MLPRSTSNKSATLMTCKKSLSLLCLSCTMIGIPCGAFVRIESLAVTQTTDGGRLRYRAFDVEQTNGGFPPQEVIFIPKGKNIQNAQFAASVEDPLKLSPVSRKITAKKRHDLDQYLESIDRRYKRLYDESGRRNPQLSKSSGITGFTTVWNWLMMADSSKAVDEETRRNNVLYVLHHAAVTSELLLNPKKHESKTVQNTRKSNDYDSSLTEALIAGVLSNPLKKMFEIPHVWKLGKISLEPMITVLRQNVHKLAHIIRQYVSIIHASLNATIPIIAISYTILFLLR